MKQDDVFFAKEGEKGLNETSATKLVASASALKSQDEAYLNNLCYVNGECAIVGSTDRIATQYGMSAETLNEIEKYAHHVSLLNGFIAWCAEARKACEALRKSIREKTMEEWAKEQGLEVIKEPDYVEEPELWTLEDAYDTLPIKERNEYLRLEAKSAVFGKLIHPGGTLAEARAEVHKILAKPTQIKGSGKDMIVYYYNPSVQAAELDTAFNKIQKIYQQTESSLNRMKSDLRKAVEAHNDKVNADYRLAFLQYKKDCDDWKANQDSLTAQFNQYLDKERAKVDKIKIAIPEAYTELLKELYNLGNE